MSIDENEELDNKGFFSRLIEKILPSESQRRASMEARLMSLYPPDHNEYTVQGEGKLMEGILAELNEKSSTTYALYVRLVDDRLYNGNMDKKALLNVYNIGSKDADILLEVNIGHHAFYGNDLLHIINPLKQRIIKGVPSVETFKEVLLDSLTEIYTVDGGAFVMEGNSPERSMAKKYISKKLGEGWENPKSNAPDLIGPKPETGDKSPFDGYSTDTDKGLPFPSYSFLLSSVKYFSAKDKVREFEEKKGWNDVEPHEMLTVYLELKKEDDLDAASKYKNDILGMRSTLSFLYNIGSYGRPDSSLYNGNGFLHRDNTGCTGQEKTTIVIAAAGEISLRTQDETRSLLKEGLRVPYDLRSNVPISQTCLDELSTLEKSFVEYVHEPKGTTEELKEIWSSVTGLENKDSPLTTVWNKTLQPSFALSFQNPSVDEHDLDIRNGTTFGMVTIS